MLAALLFSFCYSGEQRCAECCLQIMKCMSVVRLRSNQWLLCMANCKLYFYIGLAEGLKCAGRKAIKYVKEGAYRTGMSGITISRSPPATSWCVRVLMDCCKFHLVHRHPAAYHGQEKVVLVTLSKGKVIPVVSGGRG